MRLFSIMDKMTAETVVVAADVGDVSTLRNVLEKCPFEVCNTVCHACAELSLHLEERCMQGLCVQSVSQYFFGMSRIAIKYHSCPRVSWVSMDF